LPALIHLPSPSRTKFPSACTGQNNGGIA
jgi:hypothetical protein